MQGLKRKLKKIPKKKALAITAELLCALVDDILKHEANQYLAMRDILVLVCCFLLGLRAVDIEVVNVDHIENLISFETDVNLSYFDLIVCT